jgi:hypothetical protein
MSTNPIRARYRCTEDELYSIEELSANNLEARRASYFAKSTNYTAAFVLGIKALRTAAMALPNEDQRAAMHKNYGDLLPGLMEPVKADFRLLQQYIQDGWPDVNPNTRWEEAGLNKYRKIGETNWEEVVQLNNMMTAFLGEPTNVTALTTPGGMIATFVADVTTNFTAFNDVYTQFKVTRETTTSRNAKITANNTLYDAGAKYRKFGVTTVFPNDSGIMKEFTFTDLKFLVSPPGSASLKVTLKKAGTFLPLANIDVTIQAEGEAAMTGKTNAEGELPFVSINPDPYTVTIAVPGGDIVIEKDVNTGVQARLDVIVP